MRERLLLGAPVVAIAAVGALAAACDSTAPSAAPGDAGDPPYLVFLAEWEAGARDPVIINGIEIRPGPTPSEPCDGERDWSHAETAFDTNLDPRPGSLPAGTVPSLTPLEGMTCDGAPHWSEANYTLPGPEDGGRWGGSLSVFRFRGEPAFHLDHPTDRLEPAEIGSRAAIVSPPLTEDGFGPSAVLINETWGLTVVRADGLTLEELMNVAASLGR